MQDYIINVNDIEEWQTINNMIELERVFDRAKQAIVNGKSVLLTRRQHSGNIEKFDELRTLDELTDYKDRVYKYL